MNDYDLYLRHTSVQGGEWVGFPLARKDASVLVSSTLPEARRRLEGARRAVPLQDKIQNFQREREGEDA